MDMEMMKILISKNWRWAEDDPVFSEWLNTKNQNFNSRETQNKILKEMILSILRDIADSAKNSDFHSIMVYETSHVSNKEQAVFLCLLGRWKTFFVKLF